MVREFSLTSLLAENSSKLIGCDEAMTRFFLKVLTKPNDLDDCPTEITEVLTHPKGARILRCHNLDCKVSACSHAFWRRSIH